MSKVRLSRRAPASSAVIFLSPSRESPQCPVSSIKFSLKCERHECCSIELSERGVAGPRAELERRHPRLFRDLAVSIYNRSCGVAMDRFADRNEAGALLAARLAEYGGRRDVTVLALPRGGVPVGFEIARALSAPLDVFLVRKLGVPGHEELAMGAIASGGVTIVNRDVVDYLAIPQTTIDTVAGREQQELERRELLYRERRPVPEVRGRTVILVDDGLATGSSMRAAIAALKKLEPGRIVVAVPVAPPSTIKDLEMEVDEVECVFSPEPFDGVGRWYLDFSQTTDQEVRNLLTRAAAEQWHAPTI